MTSEIGLGPGAYFRGAIGLVVALALLAWGAVRCRGALLPRWSGAWARLAESVIATSAAFLVLQLLGTVHAFSPLPAFLALSLLGAGMAVVAPRLRAWAWVVDERPVVVRGASTGRAGERWVIAAAIAAVVAQWGAHVIDTLRRGMTHPDTLYYHSPFAARFVQEHSFTGLAHLGYPSSRYFPFDSELAHAAVVLPFRADVLGPFVSAPSAALLLLAAWCIGHRFGVGAVSLAGAAAVLTLPAVMGTQPGQASNDLQAATFFLCAVAFLVIDSDAPVVNALGGAAAGLALATKFVVAAPIAILTVGVAVQAVRGRRPAVAFAWVGGLVVTGSYWLVRNWIGIGSPVPQLGIFGSSKLPSEGDTLASHLTDWTRWREEYIPGLGQGLGRAWPVVPLVVVVTALAVLTSRQPRLHRWFAVTIAGGVAAYVVTPLTGGLGFAFNVRYLTPVLVLAFVLLPIRWPTGWARTATFAVFLGLMVVNMASVNHERVATWPDGTAWWAAAIGAVAFATYIAVRRGWFASTTPATRTVAAVVGVALVVGTGFAVQRSYLRHRYVDAGLFLDSTNAYFRDVHDARVALFGAIEVYPLFGSDLSNEVFNYDVANSASRDPCARWADVRAGRFDYVVFTRFGIVYGSMPPTKWFGAGSGATAVVSDPPTTVYRLRGPLRGTGCD